MDPVQISGGGCKSQVISQQVKEGADGEGGIDGVSSDKHFFSRLRLWQSSKATALSAAGRRLAEQPCLDNVGCETLLRQHDMLLEKKKSGLIHLIFSGSSQAFTIPSLLEQSRKGKGK